MVNKQILVGLSLVLSMGCGSGGDLELPPPFEEPTSSIEVVKKDGQDKITVDSSQPGKIRYLGEIENRGQQKFCFISISFVTRDANDVIIDQGQGKPRAPLIGTTLSLGGTENHDCLNPGESGSFDTSYQPIFGTFHHYEFRICENPNGVDIGCRPTPAATSPLVPLLPIPTSLNPGQDAEGKRVFNGFIKNNAPDGSGLNAHDVSIVFTILDHQGNVIDTKEQPIGTANPIGPQQEIPFSTTTETSAGDTCDTIGSCFYYRIHHSE